MSHSIMNVIAGTYAPMSFDDRLAIKLAYKALDEFVDGIDDFVELHPWETLYDGSSPYPVAYVGERVTALGPSDMPLGEFMRLVNAGDKKIAEARAKYEQLPPSLRVLLPLFGLHIVWSSS